MAKIEFRGGPCGGHSHYVDDPADEITGPCAEFDGTKPEEAHYKRVGSWNDHSSPGEQSGPIYGYVPKKRSGVVHAI